MKATKLILFTALLCSSCLQQGGTTTTKTGSSSSSSSASNSGTSSSGGVSVSWSVNPEAAVNSYGGGYRVYYSTSSTLNTTSTSYVTVSYSSGSYAPNSTNLTGLVSGNKYYIWVVAYGLFVTEYGSEVQLSEESTATTITI